LVGSTARLEDASLIGFVNVDGGDHTFLLDTKVRPDHQRRGIGTRLVKITALHAQSAGCEWMEVDCAGWRGQDRAECWLGTTPLGFEPLQAGYFHLPDLWADDD
jgi:GNAT superfamily N-acetyltransferase